jgi:hypothetical protein
MRSHPRRTKDRGGFHSSFGGQNGARKRAPRIRSRPTQEVSALAGAMTCRQQKFIVGALPLSWKEVLRPPRIAFRREVVQGALPRSSRKKASALSASSAECLSASRSAGARHRGRRERIPPRPPRIAFRPDGRPGPAAAVIKKRRPPRSPRLPRMPVDGLAPDAAVVEEENLRGLRGLRFRQTVATGTLTRSSRKKSSAFSAFSANACRSSGALPGHRKGSPPRSPRIAFRPDDRHGRGAAVIETEVSPRFPRPPRIAFSKTVAANTRAPHE